MKEQLIERLTRYVKIDTQSDSKSKTTPSTAGQWDLLHLLKEEMEALNLVNISLDENGYLFGTLPTNQPGEQPTIGLLAHVDTATDYTGKHVKPQRIDHYNGKDIVLNDETTMFVKDFPNLNQYVGHTLLTTDGTTLLGADDKAGIAIILSAIAYFNAHPELPRVNLRVGFTPDEEIGRGPHLFDVEAFGADFAYTLDGGPLGELQYESFNAAGATIHFKGVNIHPGTAKDKLVNSLLLAHEFQQLMPVDAVPEKTDGYEGFIYLMEVEGTTEQTTISYIVRDFDRDAFEEKKQTLIEATKHIQEKYGEDAAQIELTDQYYNMREKIEPVIEIVDAVEQIMHDLNIQPIIEPIRGGTDGSQLSYMGMPTPNIFTGGENYHGKFEFISADNMQKSTEVVIEIGKRFVRQ